MSTPPPDPLAAYLAWCAERRREVFEMHARLGTYETAKKLGLSRQRVQQLVKKEREHRKKEGIEP